MRFGESTRLPPVVQWIVIITIGAFLGFVVSTSTTWMLLAIAAPVVLWYAYRYPVITVIAFWFVYLLQTTVFAHLQSVQGIYYPLYLLMGANCLVYLSTVREQRMPRTIMSIYAAFYGVLCLSLLWQPPGVLINTAQRLFIYSLGLLTVAQVRTPRHVRVVYTAFIIGACVVSGWTILQGRTSFFAYRGGIEVNENYVATLIGFGLIPLFAILADTDSARHPLLQLALGVCFFGGIYATLLLASRGVTAAVLAGAALIVLRNWRRTPRRMLIRLSVLLLCVVLVFQLPAADNLLGRLTGADMQSFNDRIPLWSASVEAFAMASVQEQLLGRGMGSSEIFVRSVNPFLTSLHNGFLQILFEYGLVGVLLFVGLIITTFRRVSQGFDYLGSTGVGIIAFMVVALLSSTLQDGFLFWIALGITFAQTRAPIALERPPRNGLLPALLPTNAADRRANGSIQGV